MKSFLLFISVLGALTLSSSLTPPVTSAPNVPKKEQGVTRFSGPVTLMGVTLKGDYLFVHDDAAMARGEACTYVYKGVAAVPSKLVVSFHCRPGMRNKVERFTVRSVLTPAGQLEVQEYQLAGSIEAHRVPLNPHAGHVTISN